MSIPSKILVTGGLGHIGSHLIRKLPRQAAEIIVVDNLLTQRYCSLFDLNRKIRFLEKDISDLTKNDLKDVHTVIHLAAITDSSESFKNKEQIKNVNVDKTKKFIELCSEVKIPYFFFSSSASVYGALTDIVYEDDDSVINPQSPYAESKIIVENLIRDMLGTDTRYIILRFGTIFGASTGMRFHTAINKFCYEAAVGRPLTIWKQNYEHVRPYLGLDDAVKSIIHFLRVGKNKSEADYFNETYNVISKNYRLRDVVKIIGDIAGDIKVNMVDTPLVNQYSYTVSDSKIRKTFFEPEDKLENAIRDTFTLLKGIK